MAEYSEKTVRLYGIAEQSIVDGPGLRLAVFTQGCPHRCPGCHNPESHDFEGGFELSVSDILARMDANPLLKGVTFSGGEPLCRAKELLPLAVEARKRGKDVVCFTGYTFEELLKLRGEDESIARLMELTGLLIDGRFELEQRDLTLRFRGSRNQRVLDAAASLKEGKAVWAEEYR